MAKVSAAMTKESGRGNQFVIDSIPPLGGPNEERNPMALLLGAFLTRAASTPANSRPTSKPFTSP